MKSASSIPQSVIRAARCLRFIPALVVAVLGACTQPPDDTPERIVEQRLAGTWLREYEEDAMHVRRVLVLEPDGSFRESSVASGAAGRAAVHSHSGDWRYDGTNLKRHYRLVDGAPPGAPFVPFATFEVRFESPDEFLGIDNVHRREVRYRRVLEGTMP